MKITRVTVTGADDRTSIHDLLSLGRDFPHKIEWGLLLSRSNEGTPRWPTHGWMLSLLGSLKVPEPQIFSSHLCGRFVRELVAGDFSFARERSDILGLFQRFQINFHGLDFGEDDNLTTAIWRSPVQWIFQQDGVNDFRLNLALADGGINAVPLHDYSHGGGVLPETWPRPVADIWNGYAGGLSPENLKEQLKAMADMVGDEEIWIDAETHLRNENDEFDLAKVAQFVTIASKYF